MISYALHAHDLDPGRVTGIARYALGLAEALGPLLDTNESATLVTARNCGSTRSPHKVIGVNRRYLYGAWWRLHVPRFEWLFPATDVLHVTAPIVPTPTRKPLVVTVHDITPLTHPEWYADDAASYFRASIAWVRQRADAVIAPTQFVADQICGELGLNPAIVTVTGEGFDAEHFACEDPAGVLRRLGLQDQTYLLYVGSLSTRKGLLPVIDALPREGPVLVLAGPDGVGAAQVHAAAARRPGRVRLLGKVTDEQVGALLRGALALTHPSSFEGFGLTVLEAMSVGTPVIVSAAGALPEVVGSSGVIVPSTDADAWSEALGVLDDRAALNELSRRGLRRAQDWTWPEAAARTLTVYRHLAGA